jgi:ubiquinone/menaquinone biosynthesis C-methylase UbiE
MNERTETGLQAEFWNGAGGQMWVQRIEDTHKLIEPLGSLIRTRAAAKPGEAILDVGCGGGQNSVELAQDVGPEGRVVGLDVSEVILDYARRQPDLPQNLEYVLGDAGSEDLETAAFDLLFSRFGVMFFEDPIAAFTHMHSALKPNGRVAFLCWQAPQLNPWLSVPMQAIYQFIPPPAAAEPRSPGPFAFAEEVWIREILDDAGYANVNVEGINHDISMGSLDDAVAYMMRFGPAVEALNEADEETSRKVEAAIRQAFEPFVVDGHVKGPTATWIVTADAS